MNRLVSSGNLTTFFIVHDLVSFILSIIPRISAAVGCAAATFDFECLRNIKEKKTEIYGNREEKN